MKRRVTVNLEPADYEALSALARTHDRSLSWIISWAVRAAVPGRRKPNRGTRSGKGEPLIELAEQTTFAATLAKSLDERVRSKRPLAKSAKTLSCLDLFSGAGGLSIGLEEAGFRPEMAIDMHQDSCRTYSVALPGVQVVDKPIEQIAFKKYDGIDLIAGGPPCQPFSSGGKRLAAADPRDMVPEFIRAVAEARPRAFLMENVTGLFGSTHRDYLDATLARFRKLGYRVAGPAVLNAADFGVPQKRRRGFLVGFLEGEFSFPAPTHGPCGSEDYLRAGAVVSVNRVIGEPNPSKVFYAKNPDLRPSPYNGHVFNGGGRPIDPGAPCHTVLASAGGNKTHFLDVLGLVPAYHAYLRGGGKPKTGVLEGARRLTVEESALIQTFPQGMRFFGVRSSRYTQVGNAVPPRLAKAIGSRLYASLR